MARGVDAAHIRERALLRRAAEGQQLAALDLHHDRAVGVALGHAAAAEHRVDEDDVARMQLTRALSRKEEPQRPLGRFELGAGQLAAVARAGERAQRAGTVRHREVGVVVVRALGPDVPPVLVELDDGRLGVDLDGRLDALAAEPRPAGRRVGAAPGSLHEIRQVAGAHVDERAARRRGRIPGHGGHRGLAVGVADQAERTAVGADPRKRLDHGLGVLRPTGEAHLAQMVEGGPHEVAQQARVLLHHAPVLGDVVAHGLRAHEQAIGMLAQVMGVTDGRVVVSADIELLEERLVGQAHHGKARDEVHDRTELCHVEVVEGAARGLVLLLLAVGVERVHAERGGEQDREVDAGRHGARGVERAHDVRELLRGLDAALGAGLGVLVADGVHDDGRAVDVLGHHGGEVRLMAGLEIERVVIGVLVGEPHVGELVHHVHAQLVAGVEHALGDGVVRRADRVEAPALEQGDLAVARLAQIDRAEDAVVVVDAAAAQLDALAVDEQAVGAPGKRADAEAHGPLVEHGAVFAKQCDVRLVEVGLIGRPERGVGDLERAGDALAARDHGTRADDLDLDRPLVRDGLHQHACGICGERGHAHAVERDAARRQHVEPDGPVDARAGVPARVGLGGVVGDHGEGVDVARLRACADLDGEARVAVRVERALLAVDEHRRVAVDALEPEDERAALPCGWDLDRALVAVDAPGEVRACAAGGRIGSARLGEHRIVRHAHELRLAATIGIPPEAPALGQFDLFHSRPFPPLDYGTRKSRFDDPAHRRGLSAAQKTCWRITIPATGASSSRFLHGNGYSTTKMQLLCTWPCAGRSF